MAMGDEVGAEGGVGEGSAAGPAAGPATRRPTTRRKKQAAKVFYTRDLGQAIARRVGLGETVQAICAEPGMPDRKSVTTWAKVHPEFGAALHRARLMAGWDPQTGERVTKYTEETAQEIFARMCDGETLTSICADPAMPGASTVARWRLRWPEFGDALRVAREVQAERLCDLGWEMAQGVTRETATAVRVTLGQLRWQAGKLAPRRYGQVRATESEFAAESLAAMAAVAAAAAPVIVAKRFRIETREDGATRVVAFAPDPETGEVVRLTPEDAPWNAPPKGTWLKSWPPERRGPDGPASES
jgi:hypothetical protein